jgi:hypothetical protein
MGINPLLIPLIMVATLAYAYLAQAADLLGQSITAVILLTVLTTLCSAGILLRPTTDRLEIFRVFSFCYLIVFCIAPLAEPAFSLYVLDEPRPALLERTALLALFAYLRIAPGYHLPLHRSRPRVVMTRHDAYKVPLAATFGLVAWGIGAVAFLTLFIFAGGAAVILQGEGGLARTEFSFGLGWYYWLSLFMVPGGAIYFAAQTSRRGPLPWLHAWPLVATSLLLMLLQGRHRAMGPIFVMLFVSHYLIGRIRLPRLALLAVAGMAFSVVVGTARSPTFRSTFATDPIGFSAAILRNFPEEARAELAGGIGRIDEIMIIVDHVPDRMPYDWGYSLMIPLNPFFRLAGRMDLQVPSVGERLYVISRPDTAGSLYRTGFLPSIVGEMRANFPALLCFFPYLIYGLVMRFVYERAVIQGAHFLAVAGYGILLFHLCNMVIGTFGQALFEITVVFMPVLLCHLVTRRRVRRKFATVPHGT